MGAWQILAGLGLLFLILEMTVPTMFFLNFAVGAFVTAICSIYIFSWTALTIIFVAVSLVYFLVLLPLLVKKTNKSQETGISAKYIGKIAKVVETVNQNSGVISIYDERWEARSDREIPAGAKVEIVKNESLVMFVKEIE
ncbi:NfeD family protein [bacterium]|nr:NfeD family protein [bacterium]